MMLLASSRRRQPTSEHHINQPTHLFIHTIRLLLLNSLSNAWFIVLALFFIVCILYTINVDINLVLMVKLIIDKL